MRIIIFANHRTTQRIACHVDLLEQVVGIMKDLNEKLGGNWVQVQELKPYEVIPFEAAKPYLGFDNNPEDDYCGNLINLRNFKGTGKSFDPAAKLDEKGFLFQGDDGKIYLCRMWGDSPWIFYWHSDQRWVSLRSCNQTEVWEVMKRKLDLSEDSIYHSQNFYYGF